MVICSQGLEISLVQACSRKKEATNVDVLRDRDVRNGEGKVDLKIGEKVLVSIRSDLQRDEGGTHGPVRVEGAETLFSQGERRRRFESLIGNKTV